MPRTSTSCAITPGPSPTINGKGPAVSVERCTVAYGDDVIIDDVSFEVPAGEVTAVIGPNGSGKTTLLRAVMGLVPLRGGTIRIFGRELDAVREIISYVPQRFNFDPHFPITVREFMDLARHRHCDRGKIDQVIKEVGLPPAVLMDRLGTLSGGQLQRVLIAQAILNEPQLLIMDEPATGIDVVGEAAFYRIITHLNEKHGTTVLLVSHDIAVVSATVDHVICVNRKLLCSGPPKETLSQETLMEVFGHHASIYGHGHHHEEPHADADHDDGHHR